MKIRNWSGATQAFVLIVLLGVALRCFQFPGNPAGINQDEASSGYEAWSLLETGKDKWGNAWPVYFPSWGSGQSVLYSYLTMPAIAAFGFGEFSVRLVNLVFGILSIPLLYVFVKPLHGRLTALIATLLLAVAPWHVMLSRWGLEANLLPFFLLLGCATTAAALRDHRFIPFAFLPWAIGLYAYGVAIVIVPVLICLVLLTNLRLAFAHWVKWVCALALAGLTAAPLGLFLLKNFVVKRDLGIEGILPFGIPMLEAQRIDQVKEPLGKMIAKNVAFVFNGFRDDLISNSPVLLSPLTLGIFGFLAVGVALLLYRAFVRKQTDISLIWLIACVPLLAVSLMNINRMNAVFIPLIVVSAVGFTAVYRALEDRVVQRCLAIGVGAWLCMNTLLFATDYFVRYKDRAGAAFGKDLNFALGVARNRAAPEEDIYVCPLPIVYMSVAFHERIPPQDFQRQAIYDVDPDGTFNVSRVGRYLFDGDVIAQNGGDTYVCVMLDRDPVPGIAVETLWEAGHWKVVRVQGGRSEAEQEAL